MAIIGMLEKVTLEKASCGSLITLIFLSVIVVLLQILIGATGINYYARAISDEVIRFFLIFLSMQSFKLVSTPGVLISFSEIFWGIFINFIFFKPAYYEDLGILTAVAITNVVLLASISLLVSMVYLRNSLKGELIFYGLMFSAIIKISFYNLTHRLSPDNVSGSLALAIYAASIMIIIAIYLIVRNNLKSKYELR